VYGGRDAEIYPPSPCMLFFPVVAAVYWYAVSITTKPERPCFLSLFVAVMTSFA